MPSIKKITITTGTSVAVKTIINNRKYNDKKQLTSSVPTTETLAELYGSKLPGTSKSFDSFLKDLHKQAESNVDAANSILRRAGEPTINLPTGASFNNCNGKWTEYGYAAYAWNCLAKINDANRKENDSDHEVFVYVKLPNRNSDNNEWSQLLIPDITKKYTTPTVFCQAVRTVSHANQFSKTTRKIICGSIRHSNIILEIAVLELFRDLKLLMKLIAAFLNIFRHC